MTLTLAVPLSWPAAAQDTDCVAGPATLDIAESIPPVELDRTLSTDEIKLRRQRLGDLPAQGMSLGYYEATVGSQYDADVGGGRLATGTMCLSVKSLRVRFGFERRKILIARALGGFPCVSNYVERHERVHVVIDEALLLSSFLPRLKMSLTDRLLRGLSASAPDANSAGVLLKAAIENLLGDFRFAFARERTALQVKVDAEDGGERLVAECGAELRRFLSLGQ